ncbi:conserved hypothetical protein [uncultured Desulfobacterium sp.]|uniref:FIST C-domain domain-containing protein n=1 Tax=uncultured Desulfobacterium sp. TaxID=201089 RepID=A0A445MQL9_9BACT|nr:conserved hypothetical protein [uncultured Desulfobacterium sp.]
MLVGIGYCNEEGAFSSGKKAAEIAMRHGGIKNADLVIAFCHGLMDHHEFFRGLRAIAGPDAPIIGGSAIGVITNDHLSYRGFPACAAMIESHDIRWSIAAEGGLGSDGKQAGRNLAARLSSTAADQLLFILYDSIKSCARDNAPPQLNASSLLLEGIEQVLTPGMPIIGAGLLGDYDMNPAKQFCGSYVADQSVVGVLLGGGFTPYYRIMHGCIPLDGIYHTITRMEGPFLYELDGRPIANMIDDIYGNQNWRNINPVSLLTIGVNHGERFGETDEAHYVNRLIVGALPGGEGVSLFEPDLETGMHVQFMLRDTEMMIVSARKNSEQLIEQIFAHGKRPVFGIYIDCAGRAAGYLSVMKEEANEVQGVLNRHKIPMLGFYSGVEIAPLLNKSRGLDWTGVLLVFAKD